MSNDQIPHAKAGAMCPQFKKDVSKVCHRCAWWVGLTWKDEKGESQHKWNCAMVMTALTNVDVVKATAGTQAATESFRNEMMVRSGVAPLGGVMIDRRGASPLVGSNGSTPKLIAAD